MILHLKLIFIRFSYDLLIYMQFVDLEEHFLDLMIYN